MTAEKPEFNIGIEERPWDEVDTLRMEVAAGNRAATFLKDAIGRDGVTALIADMAERSARQWQQLIKESGGEFRPYVMTFRVTGLSADAFWQYAMANGGERLQFRMHPEHYISHLPQGYAGPATIAERWGSIMVLCQGRFSTPEVLNEAGIDYSGVWEAGASHRVAGIATSVDGAFFNAVFHQVVPMDTGFIFKTCAFLPKILPEDVRIGVEEHGAIEYANLIRLAKAKAPLPEADLGR